MHLVIKSCLLLALLTGISGCVTYEAYVSDIDSERKVASSTTHLERIVGENEMNTKNLQVAVLVANDHNEKSYVAIAPSSISTIAVSGIDPSLIRSLSIEDAKEFLRVLKFSTESYNKKLSKTESINASFLSHLQSKIYLFEGTTQLAPRITDILTFTFANKAGYSGGSKKAKLHFGDYHNKTLNKEQLELLTELLEMAINKIEAQ